MGPSGKHAGETLGENPKNLEAAECLLAAKKAAAAGTIHLGAILEGVS
jgi:hypothetical protein